jgi:hypothetical protein
VDRFRAPKPELEAFRNEPTNLGKQLSKETAKAEIDRLNKAAVRVRRRVVRGGFPGC